MNWIWQGALLVVVAGGYARLCRHLPAAPRYRLWWGTMLGLLALPAVTIVLRNTEAIAVSVPLQQPVAELPSALVLAGPALAALWAVWIAVALIRLVAALFLLRRIKASCIPFPRAREARLPRWQAARGDGRRARLAVSPVIRSAAVLGGRSPVIAVAPGLLDRLDDQEMDQIVLHEWAHVQRRDDVAQLVQQVISAMCGLHPAVWWSGRQLQLERELACDERVVAATGSPKTYAACLAKLATLVAGQVDAVELPAALGSAQLTTRIVRLLHRPGPFNPRRTIAWVTVGAALLLATGVLAARSPLVGRLRPQFEPRVASNPVPAFEAPVTRVGSSGAVAPAEEDRRHATRPLERVSASTQGSQPHADSAIPARHVQSKFEAVGLHMTPLPEVPGGAVTRTSHPSIAELRADALVSGLPGALVRLTEPSASEQASQPARRWSAAADAGVAIGRGSTNAAQATASFFTRMSRSIAGRF